MTSSKSSEVSTQVAAENPSSVTFQQMERMAASVAKSGLFGMKTHEQALALMLLAQSEGVHPMTAARDYHLIEGRPALKSDAMLARFLSAGGKVQWVKNTDACVTAVFTHPQTGSLEITWDDARVAKAELAGRPNHKKFPQQMKRARVISEGVRAMFPGVAIGSYTIEELQDITPEIKVVSQAEAIEKAGANPLTDEEKGEHLNAISSATKTDTLKAAFAAAYKHAKEAKDEVALAEFTEEYEAGKRAIAQSAVQS